MAGPGDRRAGFKIQAATTRRGMSFVARIPEFWVDPTGCFRKIRISRIKIHPFYPLAGGCWVLRLRSIQCLRGISAIFVVLYHLNDRVFFFGWAGVDLFFVISGFIMGTIGVREAPSEFIRNRIVRVAPIYWAATIFLCVIATTSDIMSNFEFRFEDLIKSLLFIPYFDGNGKIWPLVIPGWTLNYEMFFYAIFAACLLTARPVGLCLLALGGLVLAGLVLRPDSAPLRTWTDPLLLEFAAGVALASIDWRRGVRIGAAALAIGSIGFVLAIFASAGGGHGPWFRVTTFGLSSLLIVFGFLSLEKGISWPSFLRPLEHIGDISYSVYILHTIILSAVLKFLGTTPATMLVGMILVFLIAEASYHLFEVRLNRLLRAPRRSGRTKEARAQPG